MPDLGYEVKEFKAFHWKLQGWEKLERRLTGSEFDCGGHKWCVLPGSHHSRNLEFHSGGYSSFRSATSTPLRLTPSLSTSIMSTPRHGWVGTLGPNSLWSSQILMIPPSIASVVRSSLVWVFSNSQGPPSQMHITGSLPYSPTGVSPISLN